LLKSILPAGLQSGLKKLMGQASPIERVLEKIEKRDVHLKTLDALEVFGRDGKWQATCYGPLVNSLEIWEIQEKYREALKTNLPGAEVKITDSFQEIRRTTKKYSLVVIDNSMGTYLDDPIPGGVVTTYCEHFELFPDVFQVLKDSAILIVNVIPWANVASREKYPDLFNKTQLERRAQFYNTTSPDDISLEKLEETYQQLAKQNGFNLDWSFSEQRGGTGIVYYLVLKISRQPAR
jgi:hypothetical protein